MEGAVALQYAGLSGAETHTFGSDLTEGGHK